MIDSRLYPYQVAGAQFLAERASAMLADDMGIGKTAQAIAACDLAGVQTAVVVCPGIARENWKREFASWGQRNRRCYVVRGTPDLLNVRALTADVLIISYALLAQEKARRWLARHRFDALICDEAQALKSPESKRSKAVYGSKFDRSHGLASLCDRVWLLTGTPMPNHPGEMWTHVRALWPESLAGVGLRHDEWLWNFCRLDEMTGAVIGARRVPELLTLLKPHVLQRRQIDVQPELPPLRWSNVTVAPDTVPPLPPELAAATSVLAAALAEAKGDDAAAAIAEAEAMHLATLRRWTGVAKAGAVVDLLKADLMPGWSPWSSSAATSRCWRQSPGASGPAVLCCSVGQNPTSGSRSLTTSKPGACGGWCARCRSPAPPSR